MPEYLAPGVYVEEVSTGPKPIEGVSTSVAGFLGPTERGPEEIRYISSFLEFTRWYGEHLGVDKSFMSYAVQGFFDNGGKRCYVGRVLGGAAKAAADLAVNGLVCKAIGRGEWGNRLFLRVVRATKALKPRGENDPARDWVRVQVLYFRPINSDVTPATIFDPFKNPPETDRTKLRPWIVEDFDDLSLKPSAPNSLITTINLGSKLIRVAKPAGGAEIEVTPVNADGPFQQFQNGDGNLPTTLNDYEGGLESINPAPDPDHLLGFGFGMAAMDTVDAVSLLLIPDQAKSELGADLTTLAIRSCELLKDRFAILSTPLDFQKEDPDLQHDTTFGALYHPWIWVYDPDTRDDQLIPPSGHMAGIIARTDIEQGVFKAPANAVIVGAKDLQYPITKADQDILNPIGVNCIRDFRGDQRGIRLWGARTMSSDPEWKYVNVRRLFLYIEESIDEGTQWVVFESNNYETWGRVQRSVSNFLTTVWRAGGLFGSKPEDAFFVRCDESTMSEDDINNGRLVCQIGICPVRPAEFVIFRIGQKTADALS